VFDVFSYLVALKKKKFLVITFELY
jgi:hypothetical protein